MNTKQKEQKRTRPTALDRQIERHNAAVFAEIRDREAQQKRVEAACQRAWEESGEAKVYVEFLPSEHGNGYTACVESSRKNWRKLYGHLRGVARVREVIGATATRDAFAAGVVAFFQSAGVRFVDRPEPARNNMALSRPWWTALSGNYEGDVPRLLIDYTMAERVLRLMEMAQESLARGDGHMARLQAICARDYRQECPRPVPKLAALLDGIATGRVGLVRLDDPDGRVAAIVDGVPAVISRFDRAVEEPRRKRVLWWQREGN